MFRSLAPWVLALGVVVLGGPALGATPFEGWAFDVAKAEKKNDLDALAALAKGSPGFARIWFYGQVFDLATEAVPEAVKTKIRPRLQRVAETLAAATPPDTTPLLFLDRVDSGVLAKETERARKMQADAISAVRANTPIGASLAVIEDPEMASWVFSTLLYRANLASRRLGGAQESAVLTKVARRTAEGFALAFDDIAPWITLRAWHGGPMPTEPSAIEAGIDLALDLYADGKKVEARKRFERVLKDARGSRGKSLITALLLNGVANAAGWSGDRKAEKAARVKVLQAVRPLQRPSMVALAAGQLVGAHVADGTLTQMLPYLKELRALGPAVEGVAAHLRVLDAARQALSEGAARALEAGDLEDAELLLVESRALAGILAKPESVARTTPAAQVDAVRRSRLRDEAEVLRMEARIASRRGRFTQARTAFDRAHALYSETLTDVPAAAAVAGEQAELALATGDLRRALSHAAAALDHADAPVIAARAYRVQGTVRLRQGRWAPAFANANRGLTVLRDAGVHTEHTHLRARLHVLAGSALMAVGYAEPGLARLAQAVALDPIDLDVTRAAVAAHLAQGQTDVALGLLDGVGRGPRGREARVLKGCVLTLAGRHAEALPLLNDAQGLTLPHVRAAGIEGRTCLAQALVATGAATRADRIIAPIRAEMANPTADASLAWRVLAIDGQAALARGDVLTAARRWRLALQRYDEVAQERPERGLTVDLGLLGAPATADTLLSEGPTVFTKAAAKASADEREALLRTALAASLYRRAVATAPRGGALLESGVRPIEAEAGFRAALGRVADLRRVLSDHAVRHNDRGRLTKVFAEAVQAVARGRAEMARQAPAWTAYVAPRLHPPRALEPKADEALVVYAVGDDASHAWLALAGKPTRHYALPGRAALTAALKPAFDALKTPPTPWPAEPKKPTDPNAESWALLQAPVATVMPFLADAAADLAGKTVRLIPDGPLVRLPFASLVIEPPPAEPLGAPPVFLGTRYPIRTHLQLSPAGTRAPAPTKTLGVFGPLGPGADCPPGPGALDLCKGPDQGAEAEEIKAAFAVAPTKYGALEGASATAAGFEKSLAEYAVVQVVGPVDAAQGAILATPASAGPFARLTGKAWALGAPSAAHTVILSRPSAQADTDAHGLRRLAAALRLRGVERLVVVATRTGRDPERAGALAAHLAQGKGVAEALSTVQAIEAKAVVDPVEGGPALHHPYGWGRWILFE